MQLLSRTKPPIKNVEEPKSNDIIQRLYWIFANLKAVSPKRDGTVPKAKLYRLLDLEQRIDVRRPVAVMSIQHNRY